MRYIISIPVIAMILIILIMMILTHILSNAAVEYDIKHDLTNNMRHSLKFADVKNGTLEIADGFSYKSDNVYLLFLDHNGKIISGKYPTESLYQDTNGMKYSFTKMVVSSGEQYFVRDMWLLKNNDASIRMRGVVKKSDVYSRYQTLEFFSYLGIAGAFIIFLICEFILAKRISNELKNMCHVAESIGSNMDMSQRMNYDGKFHEINILAEANNRMLDKMEQTFQMQEQFTSDVAHELKTPIAVIMAECQYASDKAFSKEDFDDTLDVIHRQSGKINTIITQLLNFSRLEQGRMQIQTENIDLVEIVQSVCEDQLEKNKDKISFQMQLSEASGTGDINLIAIIIQNLISNAIKFSPQNSVIEVETGKRNQDYVYAAVTDHGIGIDEEDQKHIFQRFYKCDKSRNIEGFGLGLALSMKIAQKHGGTITVASQLGQGSTFTLILPIEHLKKE